MNRILCLQRSVFRIPLVHRFAHGKSINAEEFDLKWEQFFRRPEIDGWELRKGLNELQGGDIIPQPKILLAIFDACRKLNEHSVAVRYLEALEWKCNTYDKNIYPWIMQEIGSKIKELGISTPKEMGIDKPEYVLKKY
ncbi:hypothetical protein GJ496_008695 [Pomphorhynchus laevis]|nr:hypothetical protein GJ496_008695 [Pomphorhynchus laevis]